MKKNTLYLIIMAILLLNLVTLYKLSSLEKNINNGFQQSDSVANSLRNEINNIYSNVDTRLKKQGSIIDKYNIIFGELNSSNLTIPVTLSLTPKEYSKGLTARLQLNNKNVLMKNDGTSFVATVDAYIFDDFNLVVDLEKNGVKKIETIEEYNDLRNKYLLDITGGFSGQSSYSSKNYEYRGKINLEFGSSQANSVKKIKIVNDVNGAIISEREISPSTRVLIDANENIKFAAGDKLTIYAMVQDRYGLNYKYVINVFEADSNKQPLKQNYIAEMRGLAEISDRNGKIVYTQKK